MIIVLRTMAARPTPVIPYLPVCLLIFSCRSTPCLCPMAVTAPAAVLYCG